MPATRRILLWLTAAILGCVAQLSFAADSVIPTLYVCGDSTAANGRERGWASHLQPFFDPAKLRVENRARGGRSSRTFLTEGLWDKVVADLKPGDFVIIQFGHNDGGPLDRDRARGTIRGTGDESQEVTMPDGKQETVHTYGHYLRRFIADARAHGATPIVASPVVRNDWRDGKVIRSESYPVYSADVAKSEKCLFVDASNIIADRYDEMGEAAVKPYFPEEHTHTSADGAKLNAELIVAGLKSLPGEPVSAFLSDRGQEVLRYEQATNKPL
jgi:lysophospholipase L1-like esterase